MVKSMKGNTMKIQCVPYGITDIIQSYNTERTTALTTAIPRTCSTLTDQVLNGF